jgi:type IV pilus assembly protein PilA
MRNRDDGFTLIELMVVVLIIAILLAIAVPTYFGARKRANDRAVQSALRNTLTNELTWYADTQRFTADPAELQKLDQSMTYVNATTALGPSTNIVYVATSTTFSTDDTLLLAGKSPSGGCFWLRNVGDKNLPRFSSDDCSGSALVFTDTW